jgi:UDPglucose--hexose-1-phosphate uridylyltransferase
VKKTVITLADGRELMFFDADDGVDRSAVDERHLEPSDSGSELRYDPILDEWVILAAHRQTRTFQPALADCPLCPSKPGHPSEVPAADYEVVVFENRFPALAAATGEAIPAESGQVSRPGIGRCEVVCFTADHDSSFAALTQARAELVLEAWIDRTAELSALPGVEQIFCFENRGHEIGVTLDHPHGQIYAYPYVTPRTSRTLSVARAYRARTGHNLFDDTVQAERTSGHRIVATTAEWTAFVPFAARWPYEVHLYPTTRVPDLGSLSTAARSEFVDVYLDLLRRFDGLFDAPAPYISALHQAPVHEGRDELAFHVELFTTRRAPGKLKFLAGSESGMDAYTNDIRPEDAAARLRELG